MPVDALCYPFAVGGGMGTAAVTVRASASVRRRLRKSPFFTVLGLVMLVFAIAGFWPQYFSAVTGRTPAATTQFWLIHFHAAVFCRVAPNLCLAGIAHPE